MITRIFSIVMSFCFITISLYGQLAGDLCNYPISVTLCSGVTYPANTAQYSNNNYQSDITLDGKDIFYKLNVPSVVADSITIQVYASGYFNTVPEITKMYFLWYLNSPCLELPVRIDSIDISGTSVNIDMNVLSIKLPAQENYLLAIDFTHTVNYSMNLMFAYKGGIGMTNCSSNLSPAEGDMYINSSSCVSITSPLKIPLSYFGPYAGNQNLLLTGSTSTTPLQDTLTITTPSTTGFYLISKSTGISSGLAYYKIQNPQYIQYAPGDTHVLLIVLFTKNTTGAEALKGFKYKFQNVGYAEIVYPQTGNAGFYNPNGSWVTLEEPAIGNYTWIFGGTNNRGDGIDSTYTCRKHFFSVKISGLSGNSSYSLQYKKDGYGYDDVTCSVVPSFGCSVGPLIDEEGWQNLSLGSGGGGGGGGGMGGPPPPTVLEFCLSDFNIKRSCSDEQQVIYAQENCVSSVLEYLPAYMSGIVQESIYSNSYDLQSNTVFSYFEEHYTTEQQLISDFNYNIAGTAPIPNSCYSLCAEQLLSADFYGVVNMPLKNFVDTYIGPCYARFGILKVNGNNTYSLPYDMFSSWNDTTSYSVSELYNLPMISDAVYLLDVPGTYIVFKYVYFNNNNYEFCIIDSFCITTITSDYIYVTYDNSSCTYDSLQITANTNFYNYSGNINFLWSVNSDTVSNGMENVYIYYPTTDTSIIMLEVTASGCSASMPLTITALNCPSFLSFNLPLDTICNTTCITSIQTETLNTDSIHWFFESGYPEYYSGFTPPEVCYNQPGLHSIWAVAYNNISTDTLHLSIFVKDCRPTAAFTLSEDTLCETQCFTPVNNSIDHNQCHWYISGADISESSLCEPTFCMTQPGTHTVLLITQNQYGSDTASHTLVVVNCLPNAQFEPEEEIICLNDCIKMKSIPSDTSAMYWSFEKGTPSEYIGNNPPEICYPEPGTFIIKLLMENHWGKDSIVRYINVLYPVQLDLPDTIRLNAGENITLNVSGALTYDWTPVEYLHNASSNAPVLYPPYDMYYYVTAADAYECTTQDSVYVLVKDNVGLPSAFTPNGDGKNDVFRLINLNAMSEFSISIYNRYGQVIFASNNKDFAWDGTFKGRKVELGVYNYIVQYKLEGENRVRHFESAVTVLY